MCLPSVIGYQETNNVQKIRIQEILGNLNIQPPETPWQPGVFILLFMAIMQAVGQAIAQGQWVPGMVSGVIIFYFILVWLIIFAQEDAEIPS